MADTSERRDENNNDAANNNSSKNVRVDEESSSAIPDSRQSFHGIEKVTADFQCFVCGAVFNTDEDRKQHLEKEAHGTLHEESTEEDMEIAKEQEELNESHAHHV
ncbi:C2H2 type zinc-finger (2 copies) [Candidatus Nitrososphaera evergladensis SR1]|jgi:uncharacterized C2H2 Zn-finger protein|uniref:C2H2 type zinc-finger (2 copies) n=1 Tax=Candidatus Nitrososphaera evergladensis SR1 TaxID=1459636 RepID=A0A075MPS2_9ARCH|nr:C2H2-type zinc finger protein [Candidatus Nitrososphaera evergladensis]AIF83561.1 C2H2 type zinc-finger (2 copies) [Candidatus Nitrososphaera evergladensis SR1]